MLSQMEPNKKILKSHMQNDPQTPANRMNLEEVVQIDSEILKTMIPPGRVVNMAGVSRKLRERILCEDMDERLDTDIVKVDKSKPPQTIFRSLTTVVQRYPVKRLDLSELKITDELMPLFVNVIAHCRSLTHLFLIRCRIRGESFMHLDSVWANCQSLQHVDLSQNNIGREGAPSVGTLLQTCPSLFYLNLNENKIGDEGIAAIATRVWSKRPLRQLHLDGNSLSEDSGGHIAELLFNTMHITHLSLARNYLDDAAIAYIAESMKMCPKLTYLNLRSNMILDWGAYNIAMGLQHCKALKVLNLGRNSIEGTGLTDVANVLQTLPALESLDFEQNSLIRGGIIGLVSALPDFKSLKYLNLASNQLSYEIEQLAEALISCPKLVQLDLSNSLICASKMMMLVHALHQSPALENIHVHNNKAVGVMDISGITYRKEDLPRQMTLTRNTVISSNGKIGVRSS